ncbi:hypothetical protein E2C01_020079 [Portunus trituberculatus]|uniref:Uncharacterized protein n=1 Tax=Portunus trituberculatus TaxID=210409 RepID=A0A5B7DZL1_PORTR|nr:hypothetical protein [Portunus trituberculatus]
MRTLIDNVDFAQISLGLITNSLTTNRSSYLCSSASLVQDGLSVSNGTEKLNKAAQAPDRSRGQYQGCNSDGKYTQEVEFSAQLKSLAFGVCQ